MSDFMHVGVRMLVVMLMIVIMLVVMMMVMVVIMVMIMMVVAFFLFAVDGHADVIALDSALHGGFHPHLHAGNA